MADPARLDARQFLASTPYGISDWPFSFASEFRRDTFKYQTNLTWLNDQVLSAGYEYAREEDSLLKRNATAPGFRIEDHAYFAQQQFVFASQWYATTGVRVDDNSRFGTQASPKISVGGYPLAITSGAVSSVKIFANIWVLLILRHTEFRFQNLPKPLSLLTVLTYRNPNFKTL